MRLGRGRWFLAGLAAQDLPDFIEVSLGLVPGMRGHAELPAGEAHSGGVALLEGGLEFPFAFFVERLRARPVEHSLKATEDLNALVGLVDPDLILAHGPALGVVVGSRVVRRAGYGNHGGPHLIWIAAVEGLADGGPTPRQSQKG